MTLLSFAREERAPFPAKHFFLLLCFGVLMVSVWMLPLLVAGQGYEFPSLLLARNYAETGLFSVTDRIGRLLAPSELLLQGAPSALDGRLSAILFAFFHQWIPWENLLGWSILAAAIFALSLIPWWLTMERLFDARIAWISTVLLSLMPVYFRQATFLEEYSFAFLFLFTSFALYVYLAPRASWLALVAAGVAYGLSVSAKDVFLIFLPFFLGAYLWLEREEWRRAVLCAVLFLACVGVVYLLPYIGDMQRYGYPVNQNLARMWPGRQEIQNEIYLHLYPDPYTYYFDRERFEADYLERVKKLPLLERLGEQKVILNFGLGEPSILRFLGNGLWMFVNSIPSFFHQSTVGGFILWLFIIPGVFVLWREERPLFGLALGLILTTYLIIRFVLQYEREHLMDVAWILAPIAAVGVTTLSQALATKFPRFTSSTVSLFLLSVVSLHLLQMNRLEFARRYRDPPIARVLAAASSIKNTPAGAVIAVAPHLWSNAAVSYLTGRTIAFFREETLDRLVAEKKLDEAFDRYGVTHIIGYGSDATQKMKKALPKLQVLEVPSQESLRRPLTPLQKYLLHLVR